mmetsp:Transcript_27801/g.64893  ORF Transcript_27801/g.64893 Transcript_27801/m.64893 type:complete len:276 (+) Transcript_27801:1522-2349(+)
MRASHDPLPPGHSALAAAVYGALRRHAAHAARLLVLLLLGRHFCRGQAAHTPGRAVGVATSARLRLRRALGGQRCRHALEVRPLHSWRHARPGEHRFGRGDGENHRDGARRLRRSLHGTLRRSVGAPGPVVAQHARARCFGDGQGGLQQREDARRRAAHRIRRLRSRRRCQRCKDRRHLRAQKGRAVCADGEEDAGAAVEREGRPRLAQPPVHHPAARHREAASLRFSAARVVRRPRALCGAAAARAARRDACRAARRCAAHGSRAPPFSRVDLP